MSRKPVPLLLFVCSFLLLACNPSPELLPTATSAPTEEPTQTPVWFPPTATPKSQPTAEPSPTPDMHPGLAEQTLLDDFATDQFWSTSQGESSAATISNGRITLSASQSGNIVLSTRSAASPSSEISMLRSTPTRAYVRVRMNTDSSSERPL